MDVPRPKARRTWKKLALVGAVVAAASGVAAVALTSSSAIASVDRQGVWTAKVERGTFVVQVPAQGSLVPERTVWLSAANAARVAQIAVRPGEAVTPETLVLRLENPELELAALEADRQAASARAALVSLDVRTRVESVTQASSLALLESDHADAALRAKNAEALAPQGLISRTEQTLATNKADGLGTRLLREQEHVRILDRGRKDQLAAQRNEVERLVEIAAFRKKQLDALAVYAGANGIVQDIPLETGQWVTAGMVMAKIADGKRLKADVKVAEGSARELHPGLVARFVTPNGELSGRVERVDPQVVGGSVRVEARFEGDLPEGVRADQTIAGFVEVDRLDDVLFVTRPSGVTENGNAAIFRVGADGMATRIRVGFGRASTTSCQVVGGLSAGDEIVVSDTSAWPAADSVRLR